MFARATINSRNASKYAGFAAPIPVAQVSSSYDEFSDITCPQKTANAAYLWAVDDGLVTKAVALNKTTAAASEWLVTGFTAIDLETITSFTLNGQPYIVLGDTGNNTNNTNSRGTGIDLRLARCKEPVITGSNDTIGSPDVELIDCVFPGGGDAPALRDCEAIIADTNGDIYLILKRSTPIRVYRLAYAASYSGTQTLTYLGEMSSDSILNTISTTNSGNNGYVTGGCRSENGRTWLLCNYDRWFGWRRRAGESVIQMFQRTYDFRNEDDHVGRGRLKWQPFGMDQREAICIDQNGDLFQTTEYVSAKSYGTNPYPYLFRCPKVYGNVVRATFQHGVNSYTGCVDTTIGSATPDADNSAAVAMVCDYDFGTYPTITQDRQGLLRFDLTSIPSTAVVVAAYLDLYCTAEGQGVDFYKILVTWNASSTWNTLGGAGLPHDNVKASSTLSLRLGDTAAERTNLDTILNAFMRFPMPVADVQGWVSNSATNFGWVIKGNFIETTGDGMQFATSKAVTASQRPMLTVYYKE